MGVSELNKWIRSKPSKENNRSKSLNLKILKEEYKKRKREIKQRLLEFKKMKKAAKEDLFIELCYCLCTPLSKAERVYSVINEKNKEKIIESNKKQLSSLLRGNCRFHNRKANYIIEAKNNMEILEKLLTINKAVEAREFLVKRIKGLGYKEASHFLRNIGYKGLAILDGHIIKSLHQLNVLKTAKRPHTKKEYLIIENKMKNFAKKIGMDIDELDLLLWSLKTGVILK